ncbi:deoxyribose-phosphate aldolase [Zhurongbacter thermophilus]|jgi:deoxyribose-phosphate aldolase
MEEKNMLKPTEFARFFDHTLLKPEATTAQVRKLVEEAYHYGFYGVCVNPIHVPLAVELVSDLTGIPEGEYIEEIPEPENVADEFPMVIEEEEETDTGVAVVAVIDFPLGAGTALMKAYETEKVVEMGVDEVDMVIPIGYLKEKNYYMVEKHIAEVIRAAGGEERDVVVKVILETGLLTEDEKKVAAAIAMAAGADFVKTSTGFLGGGATVEDVRLLREVVGPYKGVKASGGIRTAEAALKMIEAGANRLGTSRTVQIMEQYIALYHGEDADMTDDGQGY